jgi:hypothetical protein
MADQADYEIEQTLQPVVVLLSVMQAEERARWTLWLIDQVSLAGAMGSKEHHEFLAALHAHLAARASKAAPVSFPAADYEQAIQKALDQLEAWDTGAETGQPDAGGGGCGG